MLFDSTEINIFRLMPDSCDRPDPEHIGGRSSNLLPSFSSVVKQQFTRRGYLRFPFSLARFVCTRNKRNFGFYVFPPF